MIVVSGSARTGTSLMIQTLLLLGYKTPAKPFVEEHKGTEKYNPKGFYDLTDEVINGVNHNNFKGQAVKIFPIGGLNQTNPKYISKLIVCKRNKKDAVKSWKPLHKIYGGHYSPKKAYKISYKYLEQYVNGVNHIFINFEEITSNPEKVINELIEFLGKKVSSEQIDKAIKNVDNGIISSRSNWSSNIGIPNMARK